MKIEPLGNQLSPEFPPLGAGGKVGGWESGQPLLQCAQLVIGLTGPPSLPATHAPPPWSPSPPLPAVTGDQRTPHRSFPFSSLDSWAEGFTVGRGTEGRRAGDLAVGPKGQRLRGGATMEPLQGRCVHTGTQRAGHGDTLPGEVTRGDCLRSGSSWGKGSRATGPSLGAPAPAQS